MSFLVQIHVTAYVVTLAIIYINDYAAILTFHCIFNLCIPLLLCTQALMIVGVYISVPVMHEICT